MSTTGRLDRRATIVLDGTGAGSVTLGPGRANESWSITTMTTRGASATDPRLDILRGSTSVVDSTPHGNDDVSDSVIGLLAGEFITARYTGGTPAAAMTFYLEGSATFA